MRLYYIGAIIPFPLGLRAMPFPLGLCLNIEHSLNSQVLFSISHMLYLETITERYSLKYVFFKTRKPGTLNKDTNTLQ